jgi:sporulation protein YlmC with PRC-barrel domain
MILSDLLGLDVFDAGGTKVGRVIDMRFRLDEVPASGSALPQARLSGFLVSPRSRSSYLGYERKDLNAPWLVAKLEEWWHRGSFLVDWADVDSVGDDGVRLRPGYRRRSVQLGKTG